MLEILALSLLLASSNAFQSQSCRIGRPGMKRTTMHFEEALIGNTALTNENLPSCRYIASNRFKVKNNAGPKFEKRWAERKSRLANLNGFRFFSLFKRVQDFDADYSAEGEFGNYISLTVWEDKPSFDDWRTGDAFKEAHGGGGITGFIQLLSTALFILDGSPKPAFYDALTPSVYAPESLQFKTEGGWRQVEADGENFLAPDVYLAQNRYAVTSGVEVAFEQQWVKGENKMQGHDGFVAFYLQRRDAVKADDGFNYIISSIWKTKSAFEQFKNSEDYGSIFGSHSPSPKPSYYEGKLALVSSKGG